MIEDILDTKVKIRVARLFSGTHEPMTVSDISRRLGISKSRASVCLRELNCKGILQRKQIGRSVLYSLSESRLAESVASAMRQDKKLAAQIENDITKRLRRHGPVSIALFGSSLKNLSPDKDVDILMIHKGKISREEVYKTESEITVQYGIRVSILMMSQKEFVEKSKQGEEFVLNVIASHKILFGRKLEDLSWSEK